MYKFLDNSIVHSRLIIATSLLLGISIITLSSIAPNVLFNQLIAIGLGICFIIFFRKFEWRPFFNYGYAVALLYLIMILLLIATFYFAVPIRGIRAWLTIGGYQFQTSEFAKVVLILVFAYFLGERHLEITRLSIIIKTFILTALPIGLILLQPDMGSAIILGGVWFCLLLLSGLRLKHIFIASFIFIIGAVFAWYQVLAPYQKNRIIALFNPELDQRGINYNVTQSKIAIGSAGFLGKGYGQGTQVQLGFLPEAETDFIFAAIIEEWGLISGIILLSIFVYLMFQIMKIGILAESNLEKYICLGTGVVIAAHFTINLGSTLGLFPVVGVPLPFVSAGGSNIVAMMVLIGIINSIGVRTYN